SHFNEQNDIPDYKINHALHLRPHHQYVKRQSTKNLQSFKSRSTNNTTLLATPNKLQDNITNTFDDTSNPTQSKEIRT
ncbi:15677_t:CDS:1, partial [Gigaspora margarita]